MVDESGAVQVVKQARTAKHPKLLKTGSKRMTFILERYVVVEGRGSKVGGRWVGGESVTSTLYLARSALPTYLLPTYPLPIYPLHYFFETTARGCTRLSKCFPTASPCVTP